jgi:hypothetical protein
VTGKAWIGIDKSQPWNAPVCGLITVGWYAVVTLQLTLLKRLSQEATQMPIILTAVARVKDWQALQKLNDEIIVAQVQAIKAMRYRVYRNSHDASQALLLIELSDQDDVCQVRATVIEWANNLDKVSLTDDRVWEPTDWEAIGEWQKGGDQTANE